MAEDKKAEETKGQMNPAAISSEIIRDTKGTLSNAEGGQNHEG
jgi:hypothetical protein